uniref:Uncharacterized protein n=1 Tax=Ovis aries TaxID=9940 RepID=A0AC11CSC5_SHEEP
MTQWTVALQALLSTGFPRQERWSGWPFSSPRDLPSPGIEPASPALAGRFFATAPPGKPPQARDTLIRVFSDESTLRIRWPKYWSFSFIISPSNEYSGLISFRMDWLDLLAVQGTLKSLLQHYSSKASILRHSAFSIVQLSHPYRTTGKIIAWTRRTFVGKVMSLIFNITVLNRISYEVSRLSQVLVSLQASGTLLLFQ